MPAENSPEGVPGLSTMVLESPSPRELADHVHALLVAMDPALWKEGAYSRSAALLQRARAYAAATIASWSGSPAGGTAEERLRAQVRALYEALPEPGSVGDSKAEWAAVYQRLWPLYEALATELKAAGERPKHLHPHNWARSVVHVGAAVLVALAFELVLSRGVAIGLAVAWCVWAWSLETARRHSERINDLCMKVFGPIAREHERYRVNSATWLGTALLILAVTSPHVPAVLGLLTIGIGDPVAGFVGRRWGATKLFKGRSLEGSSAFFASAWLLGAAWLWAFHPELAVFPRLVLAGAAALVGAVVEHLSTRLDDNLVVPVLSAWATALVWLVLV
jgi:dolichol kinase